MNAVNKTLYIPLYGKALVSRKGIILHDPKAEEIWEKEGFPLKGKAASKWLAYYMGMRSAVFDRWLTEQLNKQPGTAVIHIGCGMDSRICRVDGGDHVWYDVDFPEVIEQRQRHYTGSERYHMLPGDARKPVFLEEIPADGGAIVVMEGISMYLQEPELAGLLRAIRERFAQVSLLMDCYTVFAAKASRYKNPVNEVGVTVLHGIDDPKKLEQSGLRFLREHALTPPELIGHLQGSERWIFKTLYAGKMADRLYRLYEFGTE